jgi:hypothetical protein
MTAYQNCEVSEVMPVTLPSGVAGAGYGFSIRSENKRPLVTLSFATREDAEQVPAEVASAVVPGSAQRPACLATPTLQAVTQAARPNMCACPRPMSRP